VTPIEKKVREQKEGGNKAKGRKFIESQVHHYGEVHDVAEKCSNGKKLK